MKYNNDKVYIVFDGTYRYRLLGCDIKMETTSNNEITKGPYSDWDDDY